MKTLNPLEMKPPSLAPFLIALPLVLTISLWLYSPHVTGMNYYLTVVWSSAFPLVLVGLSGIVLARRAIRVGTQHPLRLQRPISERLIVHVPTIGRSDTVQSLVEVVNSLEVHLPEGFLNWLVRIVIDEGSQELRNLQRKYRDNANVDVVVVPENYCPPNNTRFKGRANHWATSHLGDTSRDTWILHMDDDTRVGSDTVRAIQVFIADQRSSTKPKHLAQGVLTYPRSLSRSRLLWLADSVRPADDISRFSAFTGRGSPLAGLHGELLLVRADIEQEIGWDFGPNELVEDARFGLTFADRYPGRSGWFVGRSYGATPKSCTDFLAQRRRWATGLIRLSLSRSVKLKHRSILGYSVLNWMLGPIQHVFIVLLIAVALGNVGTSPIHPAVTVVWATNMAYFIWMYWEGLKLNSQASGLNHPLFADRVAVIALLPFFSLLEACGALLGLMDYVRGKYEFVVIEKTAEEGAYVA